MAEVDGLVVGYLLGCLDTERQERIFTQKIQGKLLRDYFTKGVFFSWQNWRYIRRVARSWRRGEFNDPMSKVKPEYPAHLHTNIAPPEYRGKGMGKALMEAYFAYLRENKIRGVHLVTSSRNKIALKLYYRMGFKDLFRGPLTCYDHVTSEPMKKIGLGLKLNPGV